MSKNTRRAFLLGTGAVLGGWATKRFYTDPQPIGINYITPSADPLILNDASELSPTRVAKHITVTEKFDAKSIAALRAELKDAEANRRPVTASAARHSMGGQSMARGGITYTMAHNWVELDTTNLTFRTGAGTRWSTIIAVLDEAGKWSPTPGWSRPSPSWTR